MKIVIIGAGEIGKAINKILIDSNKDLDILMWDKDEAKIPSQKSFKEIIPLADFIFLCVPSFAYREILSEIKSLIQEKTVIVSLAKGLENSGKTMAEVLEEELTIIQSFGLLCGPMLAEEIMEGKKSSAVFATKDKDSFERIKELFSGDNFEVSYCPDILGASIVSVLKNIYTILFGICDGLNLGSNAKGGLFVKSLAEMKSITFALGGRIETAETLAGVGDFFATATSEYSKNHQNGMELAKTKSIQLKGEGAISFEALRSRLGLRIPQFPVFQLVIRILENPQEVDSLINSLWK